MRHVRSISAALSLLFLAGASFQALVSAVEPANPSLNTLSELRARHPDSQCALTIRVDSPGFDYTTAESWMKSAAKSASKGHGHRVGHTWCNAQIEMSP